MKPLLHLVDGHIEPLEKVRTSAKAIARLEELAVERAVRIGAGPVDVAVHHLANPERAAALAERLRSRLPQLGDLYVSEVGAVVGAHVGPGDARGRRRAAVDAPVSTSGSAVVRWVRVVHRSYVRPAPSTDPARPVRRGG